MYTFTWQHRMPFVILSDLAHEALLQDKFGSGALKMRIDRTLLPKSVHTILEDSLMCEAYLLLHMEDTDRQKRPVMRP